MIEDTVRNVTEEFDQRVTPTRASYLDNLKGDGGFNILLEDGSYLLLESEE